MTTGPIVCFGEMLLRLSPLGRGPLFPAPALDAHVGGAEANVVVALARLGVPAAIVGAVPAGPVDGLERAATHGLALAALNHATPDDQSFTTADDLAAFEIVAGDVWR